LLIYYDVGLLRLRLLKIQSKTNVKCEKYIRRITHAESMIYGWREYPLANIPTLTLILEIIIL